MASDKSREKQAPSSSEKAHTAVVRYPALQLLRSGANYRFLAIHKNFLILNLSASRSIKHSAWLRSPLSRFLLFLTLQVALYLLYAV